MKKKGILRPNSNIKKEDNIKWDEYTIEEHDKNRGHYPKIPEPKTPFNYDVEPLEDESIPEEHKNNLVVNEQNFMGAHLIKKEEPKKIHKLNIEELNKRLEEQVKEMGIRKEDFEDSDEETKKKNKKEEDFRKKRAQHYNEFSMLKAKKLQEQMKDEEDDDN